MLNNYSKYFSHYIIKAFSSNLFSIFIPAYLYANGFSLIEVGIFYVVQELINLFFTTILFKKVYSLGIRNATIYAVIAQIILIVATYFFLTPKLSFILTISFFSGLHDSFYWGTNELFMIHLSDKKTGKFLGKWGLLVNLFKLIIIPLSAYILDNFSALWLVVVSMILLSISIIPLIRLNFKSLRKNHYQKLFDALKNRENRYIFTVGNFNEFLTKINDTLIPLYLFLIFVKFISIGIAAIFGALGEGLYSYFIGNKSDCDQSRKKLFFLNGILYLFALIFVIFTKNYLLYFLIMLLVFLRIGTLISSETGINQSCLKEAGYTKKYVTRVSNNLAGIIIGLLIVIGGIFSFQIVFIVAICYGLLMTFSLKRFKNYI